MIWHSDACGNLLFSNRAFEDYTGRSASTIEALWRAIVHPDEVAAYVTDYMAAVGQQRAWNRRCRARRHDGEYRWLDSHAIPLLALGGAYLGQVGISIDVTAIVDAENASRAIKHTDKFLLELTDVLRPLTDAQAIIDEVRRAAADEVDPDVYVVAPTDWIGIDGDVSIAIRVVTIDGEPAPEQQAFLEAVRERSHVELRRARAENAVNEHRHRVEAAAESEIRGRLMTLAEEAQRRKLARELHDEAGQHLAALRLGLQALSDVVPPGSELERRVADLQTLAGTLGAELHEIAFRLRPRALDDYGLESALASFADQWSKRSGIAIDVHVPHVDERLPPVIEAAVYRIAQEALTNVALHSGASRAGVVLERTAESIQVVIEDNGRGFDSTSIERSVLGGGLGLMGIKERVELLAGTLEIESSARTGTMLIVRLPAAVNSEPRPS